MLISDITRSGCINEPIRFFPYLLLTPVFPPIDESTWERSVVGIFINFNPLLKILAAKPETSPVMPPPNEIMQSFLLKLYLKSLFRIKLIFFKFLFFSLALKKWIIFFLEIIFFFKIFNFFLVILYQQLLEFFQN